MVKEALTKVPRPRNGEKIIYSTNGAGKLHINMQNNVVETLPYTTYLIPYTKMNSKCLENLNAKTSNYKIPGKKKVGTVLILDLVIFSWIWHQ